MVSGKKATLLVIKLFLTYITAWTRSPSAPSEWKILFVHGTAVQQRTWWKKTSPYYIFSKTWLWLILHRYAPCNFVAAILFATFERVLLPIRRKRWQTGAEHLALLGDQRSDMIIMPKRLLVRKVLHCLPPSDTTPFSNCKLLHGTLVTSGEEHVSLFPLLPVILRLQENTYT